MSQLSSAQPIRQTVIVGGGLVGGLCALLLKASHRDVVLIDAAPAAAMPEERDSRVFALNIHTINLLKQVHVWPTIARLQVFDAMQVWFADGFGTLTLNHQDTSSQQSLGVMVEVTVLQYALQQQLRAVLADDFIEQVQLCDMDAYPDHWHLYFNQGLQLKAELVIAADGANSWIRQKLSPRVHTHDYQQVALSSAVCTQQAHGQIARQIFLDGGPLALLPMADLPEDTHPKSWSSLVWTMPNWHQATLESMTHQQRLHYITQCSERMLGDIHDMGKLSFFPLRSQQSQRYAYPRLALVGDAAHVIHPMAGQGVNLGVEDISVLVTLLLGDMASEQWGNDAVLQRYEAQRKPTNQLFSQLLTGLNWLGGNRSMFVKWARSQGLQWIDGLPLVKNKLVTAASRLS